jgi:hypothetical protein
MYGLDWRPKEESYRSMYIAIPNSEIAFRLVDKGQTRVLWIKMFQVRTRTGHEVGTPKSCVGVDGVTLPSFVWWVTNVQGYQVVYCWYSKVRLCHVVGWFHLGQRFVGSPPTPRTRLDAIPKRRGHSKKGSVRCGLSQIHLISARNRKALPLLQKDVDLRRD